MKIKQLKEIIDFDLNNDLSDFEDEDDIDSDDILYLKILNQNENFKNELNFNYYYLIIYLKIIKGLYYNTFIFDRSNFQISKNKKFDDVLKKNYNKVKSDYEYFKKNPRKSNRVKIKIITSLSENTHGNIVEKELNKMESINQEQYNNDNNDNDNDDDNDINDDINLIEQNMAYQNFHLGRPTFHIKFNYDDVSESKGFINNQKQFKQLSVNLPLFESLCNDNDTDIIFPLNNNGIKDKLENLNLNDLVYPVPLSLLNLSYKIAKLCSHNNFFKEKKIWARNFPKILSDFEDRLLNWKNNWKLTYYDKKSRLVKYISVYHELIYHNIMSFYYSVLIYYCRYVNVSSLVSINSYVLKTISHLKKVYQIIETMYDNMDGVGEGKPFHFKPFFLPIFYASCEVSSDALQKECEVIWRHYDRYIRQSNRSKSSIFNNNYWKAKQVVYEIWEQQNQNHKNVSWIELLKQWNFKLLLV
ncbi:uncharacterized protein ASCRUDRAFT_103097 [Ascoidea rubescens DSM 1968]|uniref:Uncharacterized protein n=1 Tax=Ascoidea rubescens DSM 1968 TaxID=1344418 RepID=A0A1D2VRC1_9ASCO|nr:hypothetical protein ASCRUDRAFT_103097 [Ascoidea rubescens DSM 1968]ODV64163.1 hypothetical protein ASCRUDRAFT_103097 [Ascoidea rubescens DSM 1968]